MKEKILSVIIPVYNTEKYLSRCIDSVIRAIEFMRDDTQILIINDGSKGNADEIIKEYIERYGNLITYIEQENSGLAQTKNVGIENALGKYLSFVDSDDYIDENMYKDVFNIINQKGADVVICDWETIDKDKKFIVSAKNEEYEDDKMGCIDVLIMPSSCNKVVSKELFNGLYFPKGLRYEDLATTLLLLLKASKVCYLNKPYYKYYLSEDSIMRSDFDEKKFQMIDIFEILFSRLDTLDRKYVSEEQIEMYKYMVYTRRLYEELLEPIAIYCTDLKQRKKMTKLFCEKIKGINKEMYANKYFYKNVVSLQKGVRKIFNKLLHFSINNNHYKLVSVLLKKKIYYRFIAVRYIGKDIIDMEDK